MRGGRCPCRQQPNLPTSELADKMQCVQYTHGLEQHVCTREATLSPMHRPQAVWIGAAGRDPASACLEVAMHLDGKG